MPAKKDVKLSDLRRQAGGGTKPGVLRAVQQTNGQVGTQMKLARIREMARKHGPAWPPRHSEEDDE